MILKFADATDTVKRVCIIENENGEISVSAYIHFCLLGTTLYRKCVTASIKIISF